MRKLSTAAAFATIAIPLATPAAFGQGIGQGAASPSSGGATSSQLTSPQPGINNTGTAQSSGGRLNTGEGVTTGAATTQSVDQAIAKENKSIDRRLNSICHGC